jgi:hypothetical protein
VITCNRCGSMNPDGTGNCLKCGAPLSSNIDNRYGPQIGTPGQQGPQAPGIPTWLESLRAGERPVKNSSNFDAAGFDAADLIEEGTLPSWMKPERGETPGGSASGQRDALRPANFSAPNTDESDRNINAHSLIDEQSLPSWMQEASGTRSRPGSSGPANITASSLVQSDAIPEWMKNIASASPPPAPRPTQQEQPPRQRKPEDAPRPGEPMKPLAHGFSAGELLDQQSLPSWMAQSNGQPGIAGAPANKPGGQHGQAGFSASSLLDSNAMPTWLQESGQGKKVNPGPSSQAFPHPASAQPQQPQPTWQQGPAAAASGSPANTSAAGGLSASSFLDRDSLPGWLTGPGDQPPAESRQATSGLARQNVFGEQQRVENVRVPSRPRGEIHASQDSEVAANVFASMLGVASAPNYPTQQPNMQMPPGQPGAQGQPFPAPMPSPAQMQPGAPVGNPFATPNNMPPPQGSSTTLGVPQGMPQHAPYNFSQPQGSSTTLGVPQGIPQNAPYGGLQSQGSSLGVPQGPQGMPQNAPQGFQQGALQQGMGQSSQPMSRYPQGGQGNTYSPQGNIPNNYYTMGSPPAGMSAGMSNTPSLQQMPNGDLRSEAKPAKRGLFNAIREWLSPSR